MQIELKSVSKLFATTVAVDNVSLTVADGECFFLLGPSGCGKTTLLRLLAGFLQPDQGSIAFDGQSVHGLPPHRRDTGMVFQNYALWPHMTVSENVAFGLTVPKRRVPAAERAKRVRSALAAVRLEALAERRPQHLSGGQQQRVALARALVIDPACLLLDEPLSNLDARLRQAMRIEIRSLVKRLGMTTVYVTHDQKEALGMADRCAVMRDGRIEQIGTPHDLYERPANRFVADFIGGANLIEGVLQSVSVDGLAAVQTGFGQWTALCELEETLPPGAALALAVRPEAVHLGPAQAGAPNQFNGQLTETLYGGETTECWLRMTDGTLIRVLTGERLPATTSATAMAFQVAPEDVRVLPAQ